jgi:hypothetical protein
MVIVHTILYLANGISLRGYWTDKILVWSWLIATVLFVVLNIKKKAVEIYCALLILLLGLSVIPFGLPIMAFYGFVTAADRQFTYKVSSHIRAQEIWKSPMAGGTVEIVEGNGPVERILGNLPVGYEFGDKFYDISEVNMIRLFKDSANRLTAELSFAGDKIQKQLE